MISQVRSDVFIEWESEQLETFQRLRSHCRWSDAGSGLALCQQSPPTGALTSSRQSGLCGPAPAEDSQDRSLVVPVPVKARCLRHVLTFEPPTRSTLMNTHFLHSDTYHRTF